MQPVLGKLCHRSTVWRHENGEVKTKPKPSGHQLESFVLFAGAAIDLQNSGKPVTFENIFNGPQQGSHGLKYHKVPDELYRKLVRSGFSPQLLVISTCELFQINFRKGVGPGSKSKEKLAAQHARLLAADSGSQLLRDADEREKQHVIGRPVLVSQRDRQNNPTDADELTGTASTDYNPDEFAATIDEALGWREPSEHEAKATAETLQSRLKAPKRWRRNAASSLPFRGGVTIGRKMVNWWRRSKTEKFLACVVFLQSLVLNPATLSPDLPFGQPIARPAKLVSPLLNKRLLDGLRRRRAAAGCQTIPQLPPASPA